MGKEYMDRREAAALAKEIIGNSPYEVKFGQTNGHPVLHVTDKRHRSREGSRTIAHPSEWPDARRELQAVHAAMKAGD